MPHDYADRAGWEAATGSSAALCLSQPDRINPIVVGYPENVGLRRFETVFDAVIGPREANIFVPGRNACAPKIEASDLMFLDR
jgi:hypothetical protein